MKKLVLALLCAVSFAVCSPLPAFATDEETTPDAIPEPAAPAIGQPAPAFSALTSTGEMITLEELHGKVVVLEWTNHGCPFVRKHYESNNMQTLQKELTAKGVVWAQVISSARGKQGGISGEEATRINDERGAAPTFTFLDPAGDLGHLYRAKTTPHMFVIDKDGVLRYMGAIDNMPSIDQEDIANATNYVRDAANAVLEGQKVATGSSKPYGCSIKYSE